MKAKNSVNKDKRGPDQPLIFNTVHKKGGVQSRQPDGTYSQLTLTINELYTGDIWIGIIVDGKKHDLSSITEDIFNELKRLTE